MNSSKFELILFINEKIPRYVKSCKWNKRLILPLIQGKILFIKTKNYAYFCTLDYQCSIFRLHKSVEPRLQVRTQGYKNIELFFHACSYYQI